MNLRLVMLKCRVSHGTDRPGLLLSQVRVGGRQVSAHGADDGASGVCDGVFGVGILESRAGAGVLLGLGDGAVVVDDGVVVVRDFGVGDGAAGFGVGGVVVRVVGGKDGGSSSYDGADLLGGHGCGCGGGVCGYGCLGIWLSCECYVVCRFEIEYVCSRETEWKNQGNKGNPPLLLRALTFYLVVSPLVVLKHHKFERPRACPVNSAYNAGQRSIQSS